ncbi:hypothetical protein M3P05_05525 [Sansalvadorimonas sp. 2012CJ34-2]|uniref:Calcineurin-like phosphoesterase domain-containing protein n=1 Tax=Parendozoicomonas callyspongiae TaxID=2942213 RepID=A0ABT0PDF8_9GAMM|nr:metallophosphoesterase [Sansalvadorimonas sp. 2012CJ34-2]MCL6269405.1 hypothetical protein [Sansalvadorimonas sp. 2012CJ34-2]
MATQRRDLGTSPAIAFISDAHFHDVYAQFSDGAFQGLPNSVSGRNAVIRSMYAQLTSTRLFNENYFAFLAALDDVVERGIRVVVLSGDFSDDGQPLHLQGLSKVLEEYTQKHGIQFFACNGNHDPVKPFNSTGGKHDFLGTEGREQPIFSPGHQGSLPHSNSHRHQPVISEDVVHQGYEPIMASLKNQGFYPQESYLYFETPFSTYTQNDYTFEQASKQAQFHNRFHEICVEGTGGRYRKPHYTNGIELPDSSYLVEPVEGIWLLSIDSNVYIPKAELDKPDNPAHPSNFHGSSDAGFNKVLTHKEYLLDWIHSVTRRAEETGKTVVAFGHYPAVDFFDGAGPEIKKLFGEGNFDQKRIPNDDVAEVLASAGIRIHFAGHMHFNDTGLKTFADNGFLVNIQVPSLAAYVPAYKILQLKEDNKAEVTTVTIDQVNRFDELFEHYREEHNYLKKHNPERLWNEGILKAKNYREYTSLHIAELTRLSFLPNAWPSDVREMLYAMDGGQMLVMSQLESDIRWDQLAGPDNSLSIPDAVKPSWIEAEKRASDLAHEAGLSIEAMKQWNGLDLAIDFYRLRSADELAFSDISAERIKQYELMASCLSKVENNRYRKIAPERYHAVELFRAGFQSLFSIMSHFTSDIPSKKFEVCFSSGRITTIT